MGRLSAQERGLDAASILPSDNDGIEQDAFEEWAAAERYDMDQHPLFWLFMDKETAAARNGWRAGIRHAMKRLRETGRLSEPLNPAEGG